MIAVFGGFALAAHVASKLLDANGLYQAPAHAFRRPVSAYPLGFQSMEPSGFEPLTSWTHPGGHEIYGAKRIRTADLLGAIQALSQLSYSPANAQYIERQAGSEPGRTGASAARSCVRSTRMSGTADSRRRTRESTNAAGIHSSVLLVR